MASSARGPLSDSWEMASKNPAQRLGSLRGLGSNEHRAVEVCEEPVTDALPKDARQVRQAT